MAVTHRLSRVQKSLRSKKKKENKETQSLVGV